MVYPRHGGMTRLVSLHHPTLPISYLHQWELSQETQVSDQFYCDIKPTCVIQLGKVHFYDTHIVVTTFRHVSLFGYSVQQTLPTEDQEKRIEIVWQGNTR